MFSITGCRNYLLTIRFGFVVFASICALNAWAEEPEPHKLWINFGGTSWHFHSNKDRNELNYGLGVEYGMTQDTALLAGVYKNSFYHYSRYAGISWMPVELAIPNTKAGIVLGGADGYDSINNGGWFPFLAPALSVEAQHFGINFVFMPPANSKLRGALALQFKVLF